MSLSLALDDALRQELTDSDSGLVGMATALVQQLVGRHTEIVAACMGKHDWEAVQVITVDPRQELDNLAVKLNGEAAALEASMNEQLRASMLVERAALEARNKLCEVKSAVLDAIAKFDHSAKLQQCIDSLGTTSISRKATELSKTMATEEVAAALNDELRSLNVHELQAVMKPESPAGKTQFKLALQLPGGNSPSDILSEGEQRAIAIASFLAEVKLTHGRGGIVFDDPVSSLDHRRRWYVAERLAAEAKDRQVIIFTHDIYFLCILQQKADEAGVSIMTQCVRRTPEGFGVRTERLPFDAQKTKARIGVLRQAHVEVERAKNTGDDDLQRELTRDAYTTLRLAWERAVEEILFSNVVQRFAEGVSTQSLQYVMVEDSDYKAVDEGMTKCSKFAHDAALSANLPTPHPDDLKADIQKLEVWRDLVEKRKEGVKQRRVS